MAHEALRWLHMAEVDHSVAEHLYATYHPRPLEIICYHCQQAAEKAVKALILWQDDGREIPKKHDISFLLDQLKDDMKVDECYYDYADSLTPYGVVVRYPSELHLEQRHAQEALQHAGAILAWAKHTIQE